MALLRKWLSVLLVWSLFAASTSQAQPDATLSTDIAPQPLPEALAAFANQTGLQLVYVSEIATSQESTGARAGESLSTALTQLLDGTGLQFEFLNSRTVRIFALAAVLEPRPAKPRITTATHAEDRKERSPTAHADVIVTATRREEKLSDVPISMTVWSQQAMEASGIKGMDEIAALTPGVEVDFLTNITPDLYSNLVIRGVTDRHGTTTGTFIDDAVVPSARADSYGRSFPWVFDLERVEILRGPQSTLLGSGPLAGAVRFFFIQPSLTAFSGLARAEWAATARGDMSYEVGAAAGGPAIRDVLGVRVSGWYRVEGGYVDHIDPFTDATIEANANRLLSKSARAAVMWAPTTSVRISTSLTYESFGQRDPSAFYLDLSDPNGGVLKNANLLRQPAHDTFYLGSLKLTTSLGVAELNTVTSYFKRTAATTIDWSPEYPAGPGDATAMPYDLTQRMFSQEARLTSTDPDAVLTWMAGIYYSNERKRESTRIVQGLELTDSLRSTAMDQTQLDAFGLVALRITNHVTASGGLRIGRSRYSGLTDSAPQSPAEATDTSVTPRLELSYRSNAGSLFYLTVAKGYRSGAVSPPLASCGDDPTVTPPDTLWSYEVGAKTRFLGGRVQLEPSLFHMEWFNKQPNASFADQGCSIGATRSTAVSNGFDLLAEALVNERLKIGLAVAYTDAHYTQTIRDGNVVIVHNGDALGGPPQVYSPWNITASIEYKFPLSRDVTAELWVDDIFHARNPGPFASQDPASELYAPGYRPDPSTNMLNFRAKVSWPSFDLALYANNVLDSQPILGRRPGCPWCVVPFARTFRPRTVGVTANWRF